MKLLILASPITIIATVITIILTTSCLRIHYYRKGYGIIVFYCLVVIILPRIRIQIIGIEAGVQNF